MRVALTIGLALTLAASPASAQTASETAAARSLFEQGLAAAGEHDWTAALSAFERSYALAPRPSTLLNIAGAQIETGQLVLASETYRRVVAEAGRTARDRQLREQAETALGWLVPRLAHVTLSIPNLAPGDVITLDDAVVSRGIVGTATPVDPRAHVVVVTRGAREIGRASFEVAEGERSELTVVLRASEPAAVSVGITDEDRTAVPDAAASSDTGGGDDIVSSPWLWTVVGVVVVGAVVGIVVATTLDTSPSYYSGNLGDGQIRF